MKTEKSEALYKLNCDCGRQGALTGVFIAEKSHVAKLIEDQIEVYFGEVLGKHSEIYGSLDEKEIIFITDDPAVVSIVREHGLETGHNPFDYTMANAEEEDEDLTIAEIIETRLGVITGK